MVNLILGKDNESQLVFYLAKLIINVYTRDMTYINPQGKSGGLKFILSGPNIPYPTYTIAYMLLQNQPF
jgi:hypothetical protein